MGGVRSPTLKDVPSLKEAGVDLDLNVTLGLYAPREVPKEIVDRLVKLGVVKRLEGAPRSVRPVYINFRELDVE